MVLRSLLRFLVGLYYPTIQVLGAERIPPTGPLLVTANHPNSLLDAVILGIAVGRPLRYLAKAPLFDVPVLGWVMKALGMLPAFRSQDRNGPASRNLESLGEASRLLAGGLAVGIFPEGKTHDALRLEMVRSGASRIALGAVQEHGAKVVLLPVGVNYEDKERFRSGVWVQIGEPIDCAAWLQQHEADLTKATRRLTQELDLRLKETVVHLDEAEWEPYLRDLERILPASGGATPAGRLMRCKRLADGINRYVREEPEAARQTGAELRSFREELAAARIEVSAPVLRWRGLRLLAELLWEPFWAVFCLGLTLVGTLFHLLPFAVVRGVARRLQTPGRTTVSLARLGLGLPVYGLWYLGGWWWARGYFLPWVVYALLVFFPLSGLWALAYWRWAPRVPRRWWFQVRLWLRSERLEALRQRLHGLTVRLGELEIRYAIGGGGGEGVAAVSRARPIARRAAACLLAGLLTLGGWVFLSRWREASLLERLGRDPLLARLPPEALRARLAGDERALLAVLGGVESLELRAKRMQEEFKAGQRTYYRQEDNDAVRQLLREYLTYRSALLRLIWRYQGHDELEDEAARVRGFLLCYTAATSLYEASLKLVVHFDRSKEVVAKLNEAEPLWEIPPRVYDTLRLGLANPANRKRLREAHQAYLELRPSCARLGLLEPAPYSAFHAAVERGWRGIQEEAPGVLGEQLELVVEEGELLGKRAIYDAQSLIATWIGDTKIREPRGGKSLMAPQRLAGLRQVLRPGDILLERRNWFLSNAFLPGYWPHAALYVGRPEDLERLGLRQHPQISRHWEAFSRADPEGHAQVIVEALSEGVVFASLEHSIGGGDAVAVFRPRLSEAQVQEAIGRGFSHAGKPYDFEFDFFSTDKIVCTELVFRAYDGMIRFPLVEVMGRRTMPAVELVRKFAQERGTAGAELEFVAFLDGDESSGECRECDAEELVQTLQRPGMTILQPLAKGGERE